MSLIGQEIKIALSNGNKVWASIVRLNKTSVWVKLPDGNTVRRKPSRVDEPYRSMLFAEFRRREQDLLR